MAIPRQSIGTSTPDQSTPDLSAPAPSNRDRPAAGLVAAAPPPQVARTIVLVGLMGAGKSSIGKRLAQRLGLNFIDADKEIETAAGCSIEEMFERYGEQMFRDGERRVILRLLEGPVHVLATGGGAFMDEAIRARVKEVGVSVWLHADLDLLVRRVSRRGNRPLLKAGNPRDILSRLIEARYPVYAGADVKVESADGPPEQTVQKVIDALAAHAAGRAVVQESAR